MNWHGGSKHSYERSACLHPRLRPLLALSQSVTHRHESELRDSAGIAALVSELGPRHHHRHHGYASRRRMSQARLDRAAVQPGLAVGDKPQWKSLISDCSIIPLA